MRLLVGNIWAEEIPVQFNIHPKAVMNINACEYLKIIYVHCGWRNKNRIDPRSYEHYWTSSWFEPRTSAIPVQRSTNWANIIWIKHNDQLPAGLLAQLVEHCTDIAEVMGFKFSTGLNFYQSLFKLLVQ